MQKKSLKQNIIKYDRSSLEKNIFDLLITRFGEEHLEEKTIDDLHDPYLLKDMDKAVKRIKEAKKNDEKVMIFGDYDVDGVTSTSILMHFFQKINLKASYRLPHRVKDGYGLKAYFLDELSELGVTLIVTVDCGSRDIDVIEKAKKMGIDIIVTDHHNTPEIIPESAVALINPKRPDCNYPFKYLAGAGVAFKLMQALSLEYFTPQVARDYWIDSVDICAIGTVADCMSIIGENRILVREGLKQLKKSRSKGVRRIIQDQMDQEIDADIFGFTLGPRLNAAGRMDTPYLAVNLLLNNGPTLEATLREIEDLNNQRKLLTKQFMEDAMSKIDKSNNLIFYDSSEITHGIIGIVAGRITEKFHKPSIVLKDEGEKLVASCRSPEFYSIIDLLENYKDMFIGFGGHKQAAGFSISKEKFPEFKKKILKEINKLDFSHNKKVLNIDKVVRIDELGFKFLSEVNRFKPFGMGNPKPLFMIENLQYEKLEFLGKGRDHIRFNTKQGFKIFGFFMGDYYDEIKRNGGRVSIIFDLSEDSWMGKKNLMLKLEDIILN
ncbi:MAG: single-stranded-DNA-specific exonuclease RecJ [Candidatus Gracilibacteria bacterium]|nr:single-stranded-DNA-specific exonuclease RecJ [Candidatus Gracilibacteria bacterium]